MKRLASGFLFVVWLWQGAAGMDPPDSHRSQLDLRVGAAAVNLKADDSMIIGGGIHGGTAAGQEGQLRCVATVVAKRGSAPLAIVACDVLMLSRDLLDPVVERLASTTGIPAENILINATHTHHAPSTVTVHGYQRDELFCRRVQEAVVQAVQQASSRLDMGESQFFFWLGEESSVGQNSRLLLADNTIYWVGPHDDAVRPTGPFDPELPVLAFRSTDRRLLALLFNHSTHTIGVRAAGRSPSFYGLAAQELEEQLGGTVMFLEGASGSTHNLSVAPAEAVTRIKNAVMAALEQAEPRPVDRLKSIKRPFPYRVRKFDEAAEDAAVDSYCRRRIANGAEGVIEVFRRQRETLAPHQGETRTTWIQVMALGDIALVGVPGECFTVLGQQIKRRSPYRYTYIAELANDWIGYLPDRKAFELGGYQTWTGLHSFAERGTGEAIVDAAVKMLDELRE
jgi:hypothetical protein